MIGEILLTIVNLALSWLHISSLREGRKERERLLDALIAKDAEEFRTLQKNKGQTDSKKENTPLRKEDEYITPSQLPDEEFSKLIKKEVNG